MTAKNHMETTHPYCRCPGIAAAIFSQQAITCVLGFNIGKCRLHAMYVRHWPFITQNSTVCLHCCSSRKNVRIKWTECSVGDDRGVVHSGSLLRCRNRSTVRRRCHESKPSKHVQMQAPCMPWTRLLNRKCPNTFRRRRPSIP